MPAKRTGSLEELSLGKRWCKLGYYASSEQNLGIESRKGYAAVYEVELHGVYYNFTRVVLKCLQGRTLLAYIPFETAKTSNSAILESIRGYTQKHLQVTKQ